MIPQIGRRYALIFLVGDVEEARVNSNKVIVLLLALSYAFHPLIFPVPGGLFLLYLDGLALFESVYWIVICTAVTVVPLAIYLAVMRFLWDQDTNIREHRHQLYLLGVLLTLSLLVVLIFMNAPRILIVGISGGVIAGALGGLINIRTKVSVHTGVVFGFTILLYITSPTLVWLGLAIAISVGMARYLLGRHGPLQLFLGISVVSLGLGTAHYVLA